jgi:hypothetical protein
LAGCGWCGASGGLFFCTATVLFGKLGVEKHMSFPVGGSGVFISCLAPATPLVAPPSACFAELIEGRFGACNWPHRVFVGPCLSRTGSQSVICNHSCPVSRCKMSRPTYFFISFKKQAIAGLW